MIDKSALFGSRCPQEKVELPGIGEVLVRGLTRAESLMVSDLKGSANIERRVIVLGMVEPALSDAEVLEWYRAGTAGELQLVVETIQRLSGLTEGAEKSGVSEVREES